MQLDTRRYVEQGVHGTAHPPPADDGSSPLWHQLKRPESWEELCPATPPSQWVASTVQQRCQHGLLSQPAMAGDISQEGFARRDRAEEGRKGDGTVRMVMVHDRPLPRAAASGSAVARRGSRPILHGDRRDPAAQDQPDGMTPQVETAWPAATTELSHQWQAGGAEILAPASCARHHIVTELGSAWPAVASPGLPGSSSGSRPSRPCSACYSPPPSTAAASPAAAPSSSAREGRREDWHLHEADEGCIQGAVEKPQPMEYLLGWRVQHKHCSTLQGQVVMLVDASEGGPLYIVMYDDGREEELDRSELQMRLLHKGPAPLLPSAVERSSLAALQWLEYRSEPMGSPDIIPNRKGRHDKRKRPMKEATRTVRSKKGKQR